MRSLVHLLLRYRPLTMVALGAWLVTGVWALVRLDIEAYPDPSPPLVEFITQNPSWSAEEMERQVTVPIETALFGIPGLEYTRSISIFGLSDVKLARQTYLQTLLRDVRRLLLGVQVIPRNG